MQDAAQYSQDHAGRAFLVLQDGQVIGERYSDGWTRSRPHALASGTKSFTGIVAAAALSDGLIASLDEPVSDTLVEWKGDPRKSRITVRELLTLSSGLEPNSDLLGRQGAGIKDLGGMSDLASRVRGGGNERMPEDRFAAAVGIPAKAEPGSHFAYGPSHFYAFGAFLERKLQASGRPERTYWEYLEARVLRPAGVDVPISRFAPDRGNKPNLPGGGHLTAREWAAFGEFVRQGGITLRVDDTGRMVADGAQAIPAEAIAQCFVPSARNPNYGLTWWLLNGKPGQGAQVADDAGARRQQRRQAAQVGALHDAAGAPIEVVMAAGAGKQRLYILPKLGLVVVRFAEMSREGADYNDTEFLRRLLGITPAPAARTPSDTRDAPRSSSPRGGS